MSISITVLHSHEITVSYVTDVAFVSGLSILYYNFGFLARLYLLALNALIIERSRTNDKYLSTKHCDAGQI